MLLVAAPARPAASANGVVRPSDMPRITSRTASACAAWTSGCRRAAGAALAVFCGISRGAVEGRFGVEHDTYGDGPHQVREAALVDECGHERPVLELREDLRRDA